MVGRAGVPERQARISGIILAGAHPHSDVAADRVPPRTLLPIAQAPLICYALRWLRDEGVRSATICANGCSRHVRRRLGDGTALGLKLDYYEDGMPRGAAGCVRDAAVRSGADTFVVVEGTVIPMIDLRTALATHRSLKAALTVVSAHEPRDGRTPERPPSPAGIYIFDRRALDYVPDAGFQDVKEGLIPQLYRAHERIVLYPGDGPCLRVLGLGTYLAANEWVAERAVASALAGSRGRELCRYRFFGEGLVHETARVDSSARLIGPVLVGPGARVGAGATLVGPTSIGARSAIGEGAIVSRSVIWSRCEVGSGAQVDRSILADGASAPAGSRLYNVFELGAAGDDGAEAPEPAGALEPLVGAADPPPPLPPIEEPAAMSAFAG